ncbi:MAG TPA: hypothetical protein VK102_05855 [Sphingobacterium sp.]|nr:hypothetical protein [Sphingobacterium sp.]
MNGKSKVFIFIDDDPHPIAEMMSPTSFELDTHKLVDGKHTLKIVSKDSTGKEGVRLVPFEVRNGPSIIVEGLKKDAVVHGVLPIMVNAYSKGDQKFFMIEGSETPKGIPSWVWVLIISFVGWAIFYMVKYL